jgi:hypothetical protein
MISLSWEAVWSIFLSNTGSVDLCFLVRIILRCNLALQMFLFHSPLSPRIFTTTYTPQ